MVKDLFGNSPITEPDPLLKRLRAVTLGLYEIRGELGRGGMAVVYLAKDIRLERTVAIKVMLPDLLRMEGMAERFLQEARISARLQHHNIIVVHDVQQHGEIIYFVMSLVDGCGVDEICRAGVTLPIDEARWILLQAAQALSFANGEGIVHRDVKPANILLNTKGDVIVTDFGIAKVVTNNTRSMGATIIGTPLYMSPEQVTGQRVSEASDQYSLGVTGYTLLAGAPPFSGELSLYELQTAHLRTRPVPLEVRRPDCPPALAAAIMRMLEKRQEDRWPSLQDLLPVLGEGLSADGRDVKRRLSTLVLALRAANVQRTRVSAIATPVTPRPGTNPTANTKPIAASLAGMYVDTRPASSVRIVAERQTLECGDAMALLAEVADDRGVRMDASHVAWSSSAPHIAHVDASGTVISLAPGRVEITAVVEGARAALQLDVVASRTVLLDAGEVVPPVVFPTRVVTPKRKWQVGLAGVAGVALLAFTWIRFFGARAGESATARPDTTSVGRRSVSPTTATDSSAAGGVAPVAPPKTELSRDTIPPDSDATDRGVTGNARIGTANAIRNGKTSNAERRRDSVSVAAKRRDSLRLADSTTTRRGPNADDVQRAVDRFVSTITAGQNRGASLADFMNKGSEHRVRLLGTPRFMRGEGQETAVFITLAVYRINPGGSPENRTVDLTLRGAGTGAAFALRLVGTGELQRPKK